MRNREIEEYLAKRRQRRATRIAGFVLSLGIGAGITAAVMGFNALIGGDAGYVEVGAWYLAVNAILLTWHVTEPRNG